MDVRTERTRASLQAALLELARERPLDDITVGDIVARAAVNRSTFYQHYSDKETLLADALDAAADEAGTELPEIVEPLDGPPDALRIYLEHLRANADLYRRVLSDTGSLAVAARLRARIRTIVFGAVSNITNPDCAGMPLDILASGITGSALGVIEAWLAREPLESVETATEWVWNILMGPIDPNVSTEGRCP